MRWASRHFDVGVYETHSLTTSENVHVSTSTRAPVKLPKTVFLLMLVVACAHFNRVGISVAGNERIMDEYGIKPEQMGYVYSAFLVTYTLAMLPGGLLIDRFGARRALMGLGFLSVVFVAVTGCVGFIGHTASTVWLGLMGARSLLGLVNAPLHPASAHMVYERVPPQSRALANGLVASAACAGIAATYYAMGMLIDRFDWRFAFLITGALTLVVALVWTAGTNSSLEPGSPEPERPHSPLSGLSFVLRNRSVIAITLSYAAFDYFQYLFFYWIQYYFETIRHEQKEVSRGYSTAITLAMGFGMISGGWLADRVPRSFSPWLRRALVPVVAMIASGAIFELGLLGGSVQATMAAFVVAAALVGVSEASFWTTVVELGGRYGGTAAGLMNTGGNLGGALSPSLTPLLSGFFASRYGVDSGWRLSLAVAGAIVVVGGALWWGVQPSPKLDNRKPALGLEDL